MGVPVDPHPPPPTPQPHLSPPWLFKIKMCGSSKMAWIFAIRTTRYPLTLMLCCDVQIFVVKQGVPSDKDLEWPYPSCFLYAKYIFFKLSARLKSKDINGMSPNLLTWRWQFFFLAEIKEQEIFCSHMWTFIYRIKWCTVRMHNALTRTGLEKNSSGDVSLRKEKAPLLLWVCWFKKSGLMICFHLLSCRWFY